MSTVPSTHAMEQQAINQNILPPSQEAQLKRLQGWALVVGIAASLICIIGAPFSSAQFFRSYLVAYQLYLGIALGCLAVLMLFHLTGGAWGYMIRRILEAGMRTLPLLAVLFIPIAVGVRDLYPWARPEVVASSKILQFNHLYLNPSFFWFRAALFFSCWLTLAFILSRWSWEQDRTGNPSFPRKFRLLSAPGLVIYGVTLTFASVDWLMSLQPTFHSTIFPPVVATGQLLTGQAIALVVLAWLVYRPPLSEVVSRDTLNDLGNLLFTFLIIWAYVTYFQFMLIWIANLREEIIWYLPRSQGGWQWVAWALFIFHFAVPFFSLLLRDVKRDPARLGAVAGLLLFMQLVFLHFQVDPAFPNTTLADHWMDLVMPFGVGGLWLAYFLWQLRRRPLVAMHDLNREYAAELRHHDLEKTAREEGLAHG